jgi:hypothetical protein
MTSAMHGETRAHASGPRRVALAGLMAVAVLAVVAGVLAPASGEGGATTSRQARYGGLPRWLPRATLPVGRIVAASLARPALAIEGDTVAVRLAGASVYTTAVGPSVPESGRFPVPRTSPCTFVVTLARTSGAIPIVPTQFTITDEQGHLHRPRVTPIHGGKPPSRIMPGKPVSLEIYAVLPTGSGSLSWAPESRRPAVSWDFDVEID